MFLEFLELLVFFQDYFLSQPHLFYIAVNVILQGSYLKLALVVEKLFLGFMLLLNINNLLFLFFFEHYKLSLMFFEKILYYTLIMINFLLKLINSGI
jgi:hypothetical protein